MTNTPRQRGTVNPWQVWTIDFDPQIGHEQAGHRPGIVVGSTFACRLPNGLVLVVPCSRTNRDLVHHPPVQLASPSVALCDHVKSISVQRLVRPLPYALTETERGAIRFALRRMLA